MAANEEKKPARPEEKTTGHPPGPNRYGEFPEGRAKDQWGYPVPTQHAIEQDQVLARCIAEEKAERAREAAEHDAEDER